MKNDDYRILVGLISGLLITAAIVLCSFVIWGVIP